MISHQKPSPLKGVHRIVVAFDGIFFGDPHWTWVFGGDLTNTWDIDITDYNWDNWDMGGL